MTRAFRSLAGAGVGVVNAPGIGVAGTIELSVARVVVELISAHFRDLLHPTTSRVRPLPTRENDNTYRWE
jgi:hypothetical protein